MLVCDARDRTENFTKTRSDPEAFGSNESEYFFFYVATGFCHVICVAVARPITLETSLSRQKQKSIFVVSFFRKIEKSREEFCPRIGTENSHGRYRHGNILEIKSQIVQNVFRKILQKKYGVTLI